VEYGYPPKDQTEKTTSEKKVTKRPIKIPTARYEIILYPSN